MLSITGAEAGDKKPKEDKKDKVKTAKRIAKDMEKWAKTLNQKKDAAKQSSSTYSVCNFFFSRENNRPENLNKSRPNKLVK